MTTLNVSADDFLLDPLAYPGSAAGRSVLLIDDICHDLCPRPGRRLGQARVQLADRTTDSLNAALLEANAAPVDRRTLVVSIGSNSSLAVMRRKFSKGRVSTTFPVVKGNLGGITVGHSAHVSNPGYLAAAPFAAEGQVSEVYASLLDDEQLQCLDATEPNYARRLLTAGRQFTLQLDAGDGPDEGAERPSQFYLFTSVHGLLARPGHSPLVLRTQSDLFDLLAAEWPTFAALFAGMEPRTVAHKLAHDRALRDHVRETLRSEGWSRDGGIPGAVAARRPGPLRYGRTESAWSKIEPSGLICVPSTDRIDRRGEQCVVLHTEDANALEIRTHAAISAGWARDRPAAVARVITSDAHPRGAAGVDQVLRNALGVELHERVDVSPARVRPTPVADLLIARPHYSMLRVQTADLATVEQDVALVSPLAMSILGLESGDEVVVEGPPDSGGEVTQVRLKAHPAPEETIDRRVALSGAGLTTRFPSVRAALGVHPDLPWMFVDSSARTRLGLGAHKLAPVRIRASRGYQLAREIRELLLVLVLAFVGLASVVESDSILLMVLVLVLSAALVVLRHRLKYRLETRGGR